MYPSLVSVPPPVALVSFVVRMVSYTPLPRSRDKVIVTDPSDCVRVSLLRRIQVSSGIKFGFEDLLYVPGNIPFLLARVKYVPLIFFFITASPSIRIPA